MIDPIHAHRHPHTDVGIVLIELFRVLIVRTQIVTYGHPVLAALKKMKLKGKVVLDYLTSNHNWVDGRDVLIIPVMPDKQRRHMVASIVDKLQSFAIFAASGL